jgi:hypothetical protein
MATHGHQAEGGTHRIFFLKQSRETRGDGGACRSQPPCSLAQGGIFIIHGSRVVLEKAANTA